MPGELLYKFIGNARKILDVGTGPVGSSWYDKIDEDAEVVGIDLYFFPKNKTKNYTLLKLDALDLIKFNSSQEVEVVDSRGGSKIINIELKERFDFIVADHVFEHVDKPEVLAQGISVVSAPGAFVHIGIPHADNFTDKFYHLIHPGGGGHISSLTKDVMIHVMEKNGFKLVEYVDWPDDWGWLEHLYDWKNRKLILFSQEDIKFIANVFRKELTPEKGYFYGGEYIFQKI